MELERNFIERRDFPPARRGYDPDEVDRHLQAVAAAVEELKASTQAQPTVAGAAATRVQAIVEAAERSANEIEEQARAQAQKAREQADRQATEHVERAQAAADGLAERAKRLETEVDQLLDQLGSAARSVVDALRGGSENIRSELTQIRQDLGSVRAARGTEVQSVAEQPTEQFSPPDLAEEPEVAPEPEPETDAGPPDAEPAVIEDTVQAAEQAAAREPEPAKPAPPPASRANEGARLIALNMALSGTPREETARYLADNFDLEDQDELLDEVYARAGG